MSAKHTPGKLIAETKQSDLETNDPRCSIGIVNGKILFTTTIVNAPNNAVRLCKCWNSHDALLEACKVVYDGSLSELLQYCIDHKIAYSECYLEPAYRIVILKAAIEQAEREG